MAYVLIEGEKVVRLGSNPETAVRRYYRGKEGIVIRNDDGNITIWRKVQKSGWLWNWEQEDPLAIVKKLDEPEVDLTMSVLPGIDLAMPRRAALAEDSWGRVNDEISAYDRGRLRKVLRE